MSNGQPEGPTPMQLGPVSFRAAGFMYDALSENLDTSWAELEVANTMNPMHATGPKSHEITIRGVLFPKEWGGMDSLRTLTRLAQAQVPLMLVTGSGRILGFQAIQGINQDYSAIDRYGEPLRNRYEIRCRKLVGPLGGVIGVVSAIL